MMLILKGITALFLNMPWSNDRVLLLGTSYCLLRDQRSSLNMSVRESIITESFRFFIIAFTILSTIPLFQIIADLII